MYLILDVGLNQEHTNCRLYFWSCVIEAFRLQQLGEWAIVVGKGLKYGLRDGKKVVNGTD